MLQGFNAIYSKIGDTASEEVILEMLKMKCLPVLLYGTDVCPVNKKQLKSLEYVLTSSLMKIFRTKSSVVVDDSMKFFGLSSIEHVVLKRKNSFEHKYNDICKYNVVCCAVHSIGL